MLQQILKDMYIDPELLAELSEHQKELLFVKMREEQVRRWEVRDKEEQKNTPKKVVKKGGRRIGWLQGKDGCEWVWVMGEHAKDTTIEQILERESKEKARIQAQKEAEEKRKRGEEERRKKEEEEQEKRRRLQEEEERLRRENERLEAERHRAEEAAAYASLKELRLQKERMEREEAEKERRETELRQKREQLRKQREEENQKRKEREEQLKREEEKRREELYMSLKRIREEQRQTAVRERERADEIFSRQLRESKKADRDRSFRAKIARDEYRKSKVLSMDLDNLNIGDLLENKKIVTLEPQAPQPDKPTLPTRKKQATKPPKPFGRDSVVAWFQKEEAQRHAGLIKATKKIAPWFHGVITRQQAEYLLYPRDHGYFLVRVSERIWGYALSFRDKDRAKHFLIDAAGSTYSFFGQDQKSHDSLEDLVNFHMREPISQVGKEILLTPCGQSSDKEPDYQELFSNLTNQNTAL